MGPLIKWRRYTRAPLVDKVWAGLRAHPTYVTGRGLGVDWPLPPLNSNNVPLHMAPEALPALLGIYEEYIDRYIVSADYDMPPRKWLREQVPADDGVLEYVFPLLTGTSAVFAAEVLLVRLVWLIGQCPGLSLEITTDEISTMTTIGKVGVVAGNRALYRFAQDGLVPLYGGIWIDMAVQVGHVKIFNNALKALYHETDENGREALTLLSTRLRPKDVLRHFYGDAAVTKESLQFRNSVEDKILAIELALQRNGKPADALQAILVPDYISAKEFRTLFEIPWEREQRDAIPAQALIQKMPLVRRIIETA